MRKISRGEINAGETCRQGKLLCYNRRGDDVDQAQKEGRKTTLFWLKGEGKGGGEGVHDKGIIIS